MNSLDKSTASLLQRIIAASHRGSPLSLQTLGRGKAVANLDTLLAKGLVASLKHEKGTHFQPTQQGLYFFLEEEILNILHKNAALTPIFILHRTLASAPSINDLTQALYSLERQGKVAILPLQDAHLYSDEEKAYGVRQSSGALMFFVKLLTKKAALQ